MQPKSEYMHNGKWMSDSLTSQEESTETCATQSRPVKSYQRESLAYDSTDSPINT